MTTVELDVILRSYDNLTTLAKYHLGWAMRHGGPISRKVLLNEHNNEVALNDFLDVLRKYGFTWGDGTKL